MTTTESQTATTPLTPEQMKAAVQRFIDEALNKGDLSVVQPMAGSLAQRGVAR